VSFSPAYLIYIRSDAWRIKREQALRRAGYRCQVCGDKHGPKQVHHNNYQNLGNEKPEDLIVVCSWCHFWITLLSRIKRALRWIRQLRR
jgi:5-methylcytosine-specific restriction endonuclease McrA